MNIETVLAPDPRLDAIFAALADPTRRAILARLAGGDANVSELSEPFAMSQPAVSKHLKVLEGAGLVSREKRGQTRLARFEAEPLAEAAKWIGQYAQLWADRFDRLDLVLAEMQIEEETSHDPG